MKNTNIQTQKLNKKRKIYQFVDEDLKQKYQNLTKSLQAKYINKSNRNTSINQILRSLTSDIYNYSDSCLHRLPKNNSKTIIRGDIKDFFPSISKHALYSKLIASEKLVLTENERKLFADILLDPQFKGLPQGLSISSILSEIYLEDFDKHMRLLFSDCVYIRYIDDFLLICPTALTYQYNFENIICSFLRTYKLELSRQKFRVIDFTKTMSFDFLGYRFSNKNNLLEIRIAPQKVNKLQKRINLHFQEYRNENNPEKFKKLEYKLFNIFCGVTTIAPRTNKIQQQGIPFSYTHITSFTDVQLLINNIEYQIQRSSSLTPSEIKSIRKIYYPYSNQKITQSHPQNVFLNYKFNYRNISQNKLINMIKNIDPAFIYQNQKKYELLHIFFNSLYG